MDVQGWPKRIADIDRRYLIAGCVVLAIGLAYVIWSSRRWTSEGLAGFWVGDPIFMQEAGLSAITMFVGPKSKGAREGYIYMSDESGGEVANGPIDIAFSPRWFDATRSAFSGRLGASRGYATIEGIEEVEGRDDIRYEFDPLGGLTIYGGDEVFLRLRRDAAASEAGLVAYSVQ